MRLYLLLSALSIISCMGQTIPTSEQPIKVHMQKLAYTLPNNILNSQLSDSTNLKWSQYDIDIIDIANCSSDTYWLFLSSDEEKTTEEILENLFKPKRGDSYHLYNIAFDYNSIWKYSIFERNIILLLPQQHFSIIIFPSSSIVYSLSKQIRYISESTLANSSSHTLRRLPKIPKDSPSFYPANCIVIPSANNELNIIHKLRD